MSTGPLNSDLLVFTESALSISSVPEADFLSVDGSEPYSWPKLVSGSRMTVGYFKTFYFIHC